MVIRGWQCGLVVGGLVLLTLLQAGLEQAGRAVVTLVKPRPVPIRRVETPAKAVGLTLEGVWVDTQTNRILDLLRRTGVKATFFLTGYWVERYPELARRIAKDGHELGNLSYSYQHLTALAKEEVRHELEKNQQVLQEVTGKTTMFFRPPFGELNSLVMEVAGELGYTVVTGDVDVLDYQQTNVDVLLEKLLRQVRPGSILMLRVTGRNTLPLLTRLLPLLIEAGYRLVPLGELLWRENYYVTPEGVQRLLPGLPPPERREKECLPVPGLFRAALSWQ